LWTKKCIGADVFVGFTLKRMGKGGDRGGNGNGGESSGELWQNPGHRGRQLK